MPSFGRITDRSFDDTRNKARHTMEPTLHLQQGRTLLDKVLKFYPIVREGDTAEVELTQQDWLVLLDFVHNPASASLLPESVEKLEGDLDNRTIAVTTADCQISVTMGM